MLPTLIAFVFRFKRDETNAVPNPTLQEPVYEVAHQHKFPDKGKLDVPTAPKDKPIQFPIVKEVTAKSSFTMPPGALEKPPIPDSLSGMTTNVLEDYNGDATKLFARFSLQKV